MGAPPGGGSWIVDLFTISLLGASMADYMGHIPPEPVLLFYCMSAASASLLKELYYFFFVVDFIMLLV